MGYDFEENIIEIRSHQDRIKVEKFLQNQGLSLERDTDYTIALLSRNQIIATGSLSNRVLKCIAVDSGFRGRGLSSKIISQLVNEAYFRGHTHLFIYTNPDNDILFEDIGFYKVAEVSNKVCLLENKSSGIEDYLKELMEHKREGNKVSSIVMNCNPFTLGHQYIIEKAAAESDIVHIFIVWEDKSSFPAEIRYHLVKEGTKHLSNVILHKGKDYIISNATFPSYFLKKKEEEVKIHALLDIEVFSKYIVSALNIKKRFVGEEPYCAVTKTYNETMKERLPNIGVEVEEINRLKVEGEYISASKVRKWIVTNQIVKARKFLPKTTYDFLVSQEGAEIIGKMKGLNERH